MPDPPGSDVARQPTGSQMATGTVPSPSGRPRFMSMPIQHGGDRGQPQMAKRRKQYEARIYLGRDASGKQRFEYIGRFDRKRDRNRALRKAKEEREGREAQAPFPLCDEYVDRYLAEYERLHKHSSFVAASRGLSRFREDFAGRSLNISRAEIKDWLQGNGLGPSSRRFPPAIDPRSSRSTTTRSTRTTFPSLAALHASSVAAPAARDPNLHLRLRLSSRSC